MDEVIPLGEICIPFVDALPDHARKRNTTFLGSGGKRKFTMFRFFWNHVNKSLAGLFNLVCMSPYCDHASKVLKKVSATVAKMIGAVLYAQRWQTLMGMRSEVSLGRVLACQYKLFPMTCGA